MAEANEENDNITDLGLIPDPESVGGLGGLSSSVPGTTRYGSIVVSPGVVLSPGGKSFDQNIKRAASRREYRRMTHGRGRRVVHRNDGTLATAASSVSSKEGVVVAGVSSSLVCDQEDPIRAHRVQPAYVEMAASSVPGAEVVRVPQARDRKLTVDQTRSNLMDKINKRVFLEVSRERDQQRRSRISRGEPPDLYDETTHLLGDERYHSDDENVQFLPFMRPDHVLPASFFSVVIPGIHLPGTDRDSQDPNSDGKCSSFVTILSIWNTMMGTSLLSIPWAVGKTGLLMALMIGGVMAIISCFTALEIVEVHTALERLSPENKIPEFAQLCGRLLGRKWELAAGIASLGAITGAVIVYWVLMSNFLFLTVNWIEQKATGTLPVSNSSDSLMCPKNASVYNNSKSLHPSTTLTILESATGSENDILQKMSLTEDRGPSPAPIDEPGRFARIWNKKTVPLYLLILFPVICMRSVTFFTKFNCLGSVSVAFILTMICYWSYTWGINADFTDRTSDQFVPLFRTSFPSLSGMLALGLFIHNAIITLCKNNKHPEHNRRDVSIAFVLVILTYLFVGVMFYITFPLPKWCIEDNIYNNFALFDTVVVVARGLLLLQLVTVFPLLMYLIRVQLLILVRLPESLVNIVIVNASVCVACVLFAVFMPNVGTIIRYSGAFCGFCMIFTLPGLVKMKYLKDYHSLTWKHAALYGSICLLGLSNLVAQFLFK